MRTVFQGFLIGVIQFALASLLPGTSLGQTTTAEKIGYDQLVEEYGASLPDGASTVVAYVEAFTDGGTAYLPNPISFPNKTINDRGAPVDGETASVSGHSTGSANRFFGSNSLSPATDNIDVYSAGFWLGGGGLNFGVSRDPLSQSYQVTSHSYIVNGNADFGVDEAEQLLTRLDYYIDQNDTLVVAGTSNGRSTNLPLGLVGSFNGLSVGRTDGNHGAAPTSFYFEGRTKVDIVAPEGVTSSATPVVASVASMLVDAAGANADAIHVETLKATLLAGATKDEFSDWDRTTERPIDERFGAGEVNAYNSFKIQEAGQFEGTPTIGGTAVGDFGWDYSESLESVSANPERYYRFEVLDDQYLNELSIVLSWNVDVSDLGPLRSTFFPSVDLVNLDLELSDASGTVIDASASAVDNVEHIYLKDLAPGTYDLKLSGDSDSDFAIAWRLVGSALPGDFDLDQSVGFSDIDRFSGNLDQVADGELAQLDLDGDGMVTQDDHDLHVTTLIQTDSGDFGTTLGDINLDGMTDVVGDAFLVIGNLGRNDSVGYADGDVNADGKIDVLGDAFRLISFL